MSNEVIPILRVTDAAASAQWYARLGFQKDWEHRFEPHLPAYVQISNDSMLLFLSEHTGDANFGTVIYLRVADVDAFLANYIAGCEGREDAPVIEDQDHGMRDVELEDPDGNKIRVGSPIAQTQ